MHIFITSIKAPIKNLAWHSQRQAVPYWRSGDLLVHLLGDALKRCPARGQKGDE